ncbi:MAG: arsenate reductase [Burkholderiales bacterium]
MAGDTIVYGIETCDQVRKARNWLRGQNLPFRFHDFRVDGLTQPLLERWMGHLPWDALINRRSTSWRQIDATRRAGVVDQTSAVDLLLANPTLVRRPVLESGDRILIGFSEPTYRTLFAASTTPASSVPPSSIPPCA